MRRTSRHRAHAITVGAAGAGGKGGAGGGGGHGGSYGPGVCSGGAGGGGGGPGGQGGAAGVSVGVLYNKGGTLTWAGASVLGTQASLDQVTLPSLAALPGRSGPSLAPAAAFAL